MRLAHIPASLHFEGFKLNIRKEENRRNNGEPIWPMVESNGSMLEAKLKCILLYSFNRKSVLDPKLPLMQIYIYSIDLLSCRALEF